MSQKQPRLRFAPRWAPRKHPRLRLWPPDVPNAVLLRPANPVAAGVVALGPGSAEVKGTTNLITRGAKA